MTAPDPRLGEIEARLSAASPGMWEAYQDVVRIGGQEFEPLSVARRVQHPGTTEIHYIAPWVNDEADQEFIAAAPADVAYLLAELRDRDEKLARVEALHVPNAGHNPNCDCGIAPGVGARCCGCYEAWPCKTRAAVAAAGGGGDRG